MTDPRVEIVAFDPSMTDACAGILAALPEWFGIPASNEEYVRSLPRLTTFVARRDGAVVGFVALERHFPESAENHVLAVHPALRRRGVGSALLRHAERWLHARGVTVFHVKTLGPSEPYPPYAETRAFYQAFGFRPLFETTALWGPENPALVLAKALPDLAVPQLRILDYRAAVAFYVNALGFEIAFEWRHEPGFPVYMGIRRGTLLAHLSEHEGSGPPGHGRGMTLEVADVEAWCDRLTRNGVAFERALATQPWGSRDFAVLDPFGNTIVVTTAG
jgi:GNAT superfamily N-acetyltransferase/uncharacterized glyoxalase superfamily protein PhnB